MNPMVRKQFDQIATLLEDVRTLLADQTDAIDRQHEDKDDLLQEQWGYRKEIATLKRLAEDYDVLDVENQTLLGDRDKLRAHLARILTYAKALSETDRS